MLGYLNDCFTMNLVFKIKNKKKPSLKYVAADATYKHAVLCRAGAITVMHPLQS